MVAAGSLLVIATDVTQAPNDKQQLEPMLGKIADPSSELGNAEALLADNGYFSESNVNACAAAGTAPVIAMGREAPPLARKVPKGITYPATRSESPHTLQTHTADTNDRQSLTSPHSDRLLAERNGAGGLLIEFWIAL
jgi:hypothetical protein